MTSRAVAARYKLTADDCVTGRVEAINILTGTRMGLRAASQRVGFWIARRPRWQAENLAGSRPQSVQLKRLNFIHTARWVHINRFPRFPRNSKLRAFNEPFRPIRWTLFVSNLNQGWEPYVQAFLDSFGSGINTLWGDSIDYPAFPRPRTRSDLNRWVQHRLPVSQLFYAAYPHLTTNDVRSLLRVRRELESARANQIALKNAGQTSANRTTMNPADIRRLVERLQHCLLDVGASPHNWPGALRHGPSTATGLTGFVSLMPIRPGAEPALRDLLGKLALPCTDNVFAGIDGTHFARFAILDQDRAASYPDRPIRLHRSWLVFSADFDSRVDEGELRARRPPRRPSLRRDELERYMALVVADAELRCVLEHCYPKQNQPLDGDLLADLVTSVCTRRVYFRDYPDTTLSDIIAAAEFYEEHLASEPNLTSAVESFVLGEPGGG